MKSVHVLMVIMKHQTIMLEECLFHCRNLLQYPKKLFKSASVRKQSKTLDSCCYQRLTLYTYMLGLEFPNIVYLENKGKKLFGWFDKRNIFTK